MTPQKGIPILEKLPCQVSVQDSYTLQQVQDILQDLGHPKNCSSWRKSLVPLPFCPVACAVAVNPLN